MFGPNKSFLLPGLKTICSGRTNRFSSRGTKTICSGRTNRFSSRALKRFVRAKQIVLVPRSKNDFFGPNDLFGPNKSFWCVLMPGITICLARTNRCSIPRHLFLRGDGQKQASENRFVLWPGCRNDSICPKKLIFGPERKQLLGPSKGWGARDLISTPFDAPKMFPFRALPLCKFRSQLPPALPQASAACGKPSARIDFSAPLLKLL